MTKKKALLAPVALLLGLALPSCQALCKAMGCDQTETTTSTAEGGIIIPTPGNDCALNVSPAGTSALPAFWGVWAFNGEKSGSSPTIHSLYLGSDEDDLDVGGFHTTEGNSYTLLIHDLTTNPQAFLRKEGSTEDNSIDSMPVDLSPASGTATFSVFARESVEKSSGEMYLYVLEQGEGVLVKVKVWSN